MPGDVGDRWRGTRNTVNAKLIEEPLLSVAADQVTSLLRRRQNAPTPTRRTSPSNENHRRGHRERETRMREFSRCPLHDPWSQESMLWLLSTVASIVREQLTSADEGWLLQQSKRCLRAISEQHPDVLDPNMASELSHGSVLADLLTSLSRSKCSTKPLVRGAAVG